MNIPEKSDDSVKRFSRYSKSSLCLERTNTTIRLKTQLTNCWGPVKLCATKIRPKPSDAAFLFLPLDQAIASRAAFDIVSGSDGRAHENVFGVT